MDSGIISVDVELTNGKIIEIAIKEGSNFNKLKAKISQKFPKNLIPSAS
jgi:hypothetical protein